MSHQSRERYQLQEHPTLQMRPQTMQAYALDSEDKTSSMTTEATHSIPTLMPMHMFSERLKTGFLRSWVLWSASRHHQPLTVSLAPRIS